MYPQLLTVIDEEAHQEKNEAEPSKEKIKERQAAARKDKTKEKEEK